VLRKHGRPMAAGRLALQAGITPRALRTIYEPPLVASRAIALTRYGMTLGTGATAQEQTDRSQEQTDRRWSDLA
jgi:hypothetical protein